MENNKINCSVDKVRNRAKKAGGAVQVMFNTVCCESALWDLLGWDLGQVEQGLGLGQVVWGWDLGQVGLVTGLGQVVQDWDLGQVAWGRGWVALERGRGWEAVQAGNGYPNKAGQDPESRKYMFRGL